MDFLEDRIFFLLFDAKKKGGQRSRGTGAREETADVPSGLTVGGSRAGSAVVIDRRERRNGMDRESFIICRAGRAASSLGKRVGNSDSVKY